MSRMPLLNLLGGMVLAALAGCQSPGTYSPLGPGAYAVPGGSSFQTVSDPIYQPSVYDASGAYPHATYPPVTPPPSTYPPVTPPPATYPMTYPPSTPSAEAQSPASWN